MIPDYANSDPRILDGVAEVVAALAKDAGVSVESLMLVGALCRDVNHSALGHGAPVRGTSDIDLAFAVASEDEYARIDQAFDRYQSGELWNEVCYRIAGQKVDVMPFGQIERPAGEVSPQGNDRRLVVFGFSAAFRDPATVVLDDGTRLSIATPAGYSLLKLRAIVDRLPDHEDKHARDLALTMSSTRETSH